MIGFNFKHCNALPDTSEFTQHVWGWLELPQSYNSKSTFIHKGYTPRPLEEAWN